MHGDGHRQIKPKAPMALEDAQRTVALVRYHAAEYHIDPHKIGVLGFSGAATWWQISAPTLANVCIPLWMQPTK